MINAIFLWFYGRSKKNFQHLSLEVSVSVSVSASRNGVDDRQDGAVKEVSVPVLVSVRGERLHNGKANGNREMRRNCFGGQEVELKSQNRDFRSEVCDSSPSVRVIVSELGTSS
jgi:hypothetical protein